MHTEMYDTVHRFRREVESLVASNANAIDVMQGGDSRLQQQSSLPSLILEHGDSLDLGKSTCTDRSNVE